MIILKKIPNPKNPYELTSVEFQIEDDGLTLYDLLSEIKKFIISCGYVISDSEQLAIEDIGKVDE